MERKMGYTDTGRKSFPQLALDCAKIQHEEWRKGHGKTNPKCDVPFEKLPIYEQNKNYRSCYVILQQLSNAGYLKGW